MTDAPKLVATLPSEWYFDEAQYAQELRDVWYRDWICVGRLEQIPEPGDYFLWSVSDQQVIITRDKEGQPRAFYNTCRHRGSVLCTEHEGRFRNGRIVCPYHTWTYDLDGELVATPFRVDSDDFDFADYPLYDVPLDTWAGFLFVCLDEKPGQSLADFLGSEADGLASWPLERMVVVHKETIELGCNWKIFWENFDECYHCPRVHPELCKVVPLFGEGVNDYIEQGTWEPNEDLTSSQPSVGNGMSTWTIDGRSNLPEIEGLDEARKSKGMWFGTFYGNMYVVAHPQFVRCVYLRPLGPERTELRVNWLLEPGVAERYPEDVEPIVSFAKTVIEQDGRVCELNQQGLKNRPHRQGVLVPQEKYVADFHAWLRARLAVD
jgi:Rieske 2Fe-2S family protein